MLWTFSEAIRNSNVNFAQSLGTWDGVLEKRRRSPMSIFDPRTPTFRKQSLVIEMGIANAAEETR